MPNNNYQELLAAALAVSRNAVAPYSEIHVGAALRTESGDIVTGANVESASYGLTCCAERVALFTALSRGCRKFTGLGLVSSVNPALVPCGACRQLLIEHAPGIRIWCASIEKPDEVDEYQIEDLIPSALVRLPR